MTRGSDDTQPLDAALLNLTACNDVLDLGPLWRQKFAVIGVGERNIEVERVAVDTHDSALGGEGRSDPRLMFAIPRQVIHAHELEPRRSNFPRNADAVARMQA